MADYILEWNDLDVKIKVRLTLRALKHVHSVTSLPRLLAVNALGYFRLYERARNPNKWGECGAVHDGLANHQRGLIRMRQPWDRRAAFV
jgi:hypothetical protein